MWALKHVFAFSALLRIVSLCVSRRGILTAAGARRVAPVKVSRVFGADRLAPGRGIKRTKVVFVFRGRSGDSCIGAVMPEYRVYPLNAGRLAGPAQVLVSENDREAIEKAKQLMNGHAAEVWDGARFVATIRPRGPGRAIS
jgi:hypothetical protein